MIKTHYCYNCVPQFVAHGFNAPIVIILHTNIVYNIAYFMYLYRIVLQDSYDDYISPRSRIHPIFLVIGIIRYQQPQFLSG